MTIRTDDPTDLDNYVMPYDLSAINNKSARARARNKALAFPKEIKEIIDGRMTLLKSAIYKSNGSRIKDGIDVKCNKCGHEWSPTAVTIKKGHGCPKCHASKLRNSHGYTKRKTTREEIEYMQFLREKKGWFYERIAQFLDRDTKTVRRHCDKRVAQGVKEYNRSYYQDNKERIAENNRRYEKTERGREFSRSSSRKSRALRRALELNAMVDIETNDGTLERINMYKHMKRDEEGRKLFISNSNAQAYRELSDVAKKYEELTDRKWHVDHLVPLSKGGAHEAANFAVKLASVNATKGGDFIDEDGALYARRIFGIEPGWEVGGIRTNNVS